MGLVTFQVIDGLEKGRIFADLPTPVTVGREDDNTIRLNDERVSRFHAKVQEDGGRFILTDLDSTNGTRVNGYPVQMRVLQFGDQIGVGRSLLIFGSPEQLARKRLDFIQRQRELGVEPAGDDDSLDQYTQSGAPREELDELFPDGPPGVPDGLRPVQAAQVSDIVNYVHHQISVILSASQEESEAEGAFTRVDWETWQRMLATQMQLAVYARKLADPDA